MSEQKQIVKSEPTLLEIVQGKGFKDQVALALPKHCTPERFARMALTSLRKTPQLLNCDPQSVLKCFMDLSALGIEADGRRAHIIPFGKEATLILDYKGIAELVRRSGDVSYIHCDVVFDNDKFDLVFGSGATLKHIPAFKDRGEIKGAYSFVKLKDGSEDFDFMSVEDVEQIRKKSRGANSPAWKDHWNEMAKKTVFRRHSKWLPLSPELKDAIEVDEDHGSFESAINITPPEAPRPVFKREEAKLEVPQAEVVEPKSNRDIYAEFTVLCDKENVTPFDLPKALRALDRKISKTCADWNEVLESEVEFAIENFDKVFPHLGAQ